MSMRMLIDARHPEETRVAVVKGNRIEEFDFESAEHKQLKGNIYLAKVPGSNRRFRRRSSITAATATASSLSAKSIPIIIRSPRPTAKRCCAKRPSTRPRKSGCASAELDDEDELDAIEGESTTMTSTSRQRRMTATATDADRGRHRLEPLAGRRIRRRRAAPEAPEPAPPLQDPGRHPAPPGAARPGRQGRARQQGRGADHLSSRSPAAIAC